MIGVSLLLLSVITNRLGTLILPEDGLNALLTCGLRKTFVLSVTELLPAFPTGSPPPLTLALLATWGAAVASTDTLMVSMGNAAPTATTLLLLQATICRLTEQVQPTPLKL